MNQLVQNAIVIEMKKYQNDLNDNKKNMEIIKNNKKREFLEENGITTSTEELTINEELRKSPWLKSFTVMVTMLSLALPDMGEMVYQSALSFFVIDHLQLALMTRVWVSGVNPKRRSCDDNRMLYSLMQLETPSNARILKAKQSFFIVIFWRMVFINAVET